MAERGQRWLTDIVHAHSVSPAQRRIVQYLWAALPDVAFASSVDIAKASGVSQPTVTRLATALGYGTFPEFRNALRDAVLAQDSEPDGAETRSGLDALHTNRGNLETVGRTIEGPQMFRAVDALVGSRPLGILGLRASAALAEYMGYFARRVLPDVRVLTDAASLSDSVLQLHRDGGTAMLAFMMPRYPRAAVEGLAFGRELGLTTVGVVDTALPPFEEHVDVTLTAPVSTDLMFDSHAAAVVLAISLLDKIGAREPERTQRYLEAHEELVRDWSFE